MTGPGYPATPLLRRLTATHGWHHDLACGAHGEPVAMVAWRRHGRCEDVLAELFELPFDPDQGSRR